MRLIQILDRIHIESSNHQPETHHDFLNGQRYLQIKPNAVIHMEKMQQGISQLGNHTNQAPDK